VKSPATRRFSPSVDVGVGATVSSTSSVRPSSTRSTSSVAASASRSPHQVESCARSTVAAQNNTRRLIISRSESPSKPTLHTRGVATFSALGDEK